MALARGVALVAALAACDAPPRAPSTTSPFVVLIFEDDDEPLATSHGTLHDYDQQVPLLALAPGRSEHAPLAAPAAGMRPMTGVAAMLAAWLGVAAPDRMVKLQHTTLQRGCDACRQPRRGNWRDDGGR